TAAPVVAASAVAAAVSAGTSDATPKPEGEPANDPEPVTLADEPAEPALVSEDAAEAPAADETDGREVVREGEHNGVFYRFFTDGSIEARSEHGVRHFASLDELQATIQAARGAPADAAPAADEDATDAAPDAPEPAPQDDFEAALAALENKRDR
ncbi:hypothetical protein ACFQ4O_10470, partial [Methylopila musalis]